MIHTILTVAPTRAGRMWLDSPRHVHQRLCMGWPDGERDARMLWRREGRTLLVQTCDPVPMPERWRLDVDFLTHRPAASEWAPDFAAGRVYTLDTVVCPATGSGDKRALETPEAVGWWLGTHEAEWGWHFLDLAVSRQPSHLVTKGDGYRVAIVPWLVRGRILCQDPDAMARAVVSGVGRRRAYGCGLPVVGEDAPA